MKTGLFTGNETFNSARTALDMPRYVLKSKLISGFDFEEKLNDFIKDRTIVDIKYSCCIGQSSYIFDRALVIYKEME